MMIRKCRFPFPFSNASVDVEATPIGGAISPKLTCGAISSKRLNSGIKHSPSSPVSFIAGNKAALPMSPNGSHTSANFGSISGVKQAPMSPNGATGSELDALAAATAAAVMEKRRREEEASVDMEMDEKLVREDEDEREEEEERKRGLTAGLSLDLVRISVTEKGNLYQCSICG